LACDEHRWIAPDHTPHVRDLKLIVGVSYSSYTRPGAARVQRCQAGGRRPVRKPRRRVLPEATRHLLGAADYEALVFVAVGHHDAEDLQHRVRKIGVPTPGPESDLTEHLTVMESQLRERVRTRQEVVERAIVPYRHQFVPQGLQARNIAGSDRILNLGEPHAFQRISPSLG